MTGALSGETLSVRIEALRAGMDPEDQRAHLAMGVLLKWRAGELISQMVWRHGLHGELGELLDSRLLMNPWLGWEEEDEAPPVPDVPFPAEPAPFDYDALRVVVESVHELLLAADDSLARVNDPSTKLIVDDDLIASDYDGDGVLSDEERESARSEPQDISDAAREDLKRRGASDEYIAWHLNPPQVLALDAADASFARASLHYLLVATSAFLAVDARELVDRMAHLVARNPDTPYSDLLQPHEDNPDAPLEKHLWQLADLFSAIHARELLVVDEPMRRAVLDHALQRIALHRQGIERILAETDDDREAFPGPQQSGYEGGVRVDDLYIAALRAKLDHQEDLLRGRALIPLWRDGWEQRAMAGHGLGLNLRRAILEPESYDPILWLHGTAATPYLEEGRFLPMDVREQIRDGLSAQRQWDPPEFRPGDHPWPDRDP